MSQTIIHPTAQIKNSQYGEIKLFRNVLVEDSHLGDKVSIGDDSTIERCHFDRNVIINRRSYINDSEIGRYSYTGINTIMTFTKLGSFCSVGRNVDLGGKDHDYHKITTMKAFRFSQMQEGGGRLTNIPSPQKDCVIGNDVWIAAGVQVLHNVTIGDGAVIGGGAVVTHDIPPYAIAVGVPAKIIGYRCSEEQIARLLKIKWWDWSEEQIQEHFHLLLNNDITDEMLDQLEELSLSFKDH